MDDEKVVGENIGGSLTYTLESPKKTVKHLKKKKKKKKKEKKLKRKRSAYFLRNVTLFITFAITCLVAGGIVSRYNKKHTRPAKPAFNYSVYKRNQVNTTSAPWTHQANSGAVLGILEGILRHTSHHVVCMHHIQDMRNPFRACVIHNRKADQMYAVMNPRIIGEANGTQQYREESIACKGAVINSRFNVIMLKWDRPTAEGTMYALFEGPEAVAIQLSLDEFRGNLHCNHTMATEHIKTNKHRGTATG